MCERNDTNDRRGVGNSDFLLLRLATSYLGSSALLQIYAVTIAVGVNRYLNASVPAQTYNLCFPTVTLLSASGSGVSSTFEDEAIASDTCARIPYALIVYIDMSLPLTPSRD